MKLYRVSVWQSENSRRADFLYLNSDEAHSHFNTIVVNSLTDNSMLSGYGVAIDVYNTDGENLHSEIIPEPLIEFPSSDAENYGKVINYTIHSVN